MSLWSDPNPEMIVDFDFDDEAAVAEVVDNRRAEPRYPASLVPAITNVKTTAGEALALIDISATGILIEGSSRIKPGERVSLVIAGLDPANISGRAVRSVVAAIGGNGTLRFQTGVVFDRRVDLPLASVKPAFPAEAPVPVPAAAAVETAPETAPPVTPPKRRVVNRW